MIPRQLLDNYTAAINKISATAQQALTAELMAVDLTDIAKARQEIIRVLNTYLPGFTGATATIAAEFYDVVREVQTGNRIGAIAYSAHNLQATEGATRAMMQTVVNGGTQEQLIAQLLERVDYEVKKTAGDCVVHNARRDNLKVKYARIPSGAETCTFCIMLASRGFVYHTDKTAGAVDHYHANCDCRIVPGFNDEEVEGYDPDVLYEKWKELEQGN